MIYTVTDCGNCHIDHEWLFTMPGLDELWIIRDLTGRTGKEFMAGIAELDAPALAALMVILHRRDKITIPFKKVKLDLDHFDVQLTEVEKARLTPAQRAELGLESEAADEDEDEESPDPLTMSGPTQKEA